MKYSPTYPKKQINYHYHYYYGSPEQQVQTQRKYLNPLLDNTSNRQPSELSYISKSTTQYGSWKNIVNPSVYVKYQKIRGHENDLKRISSLVDIYKQKRLADQKHYRSPRATDRYDAQKSQDTSFLTNRKTNEKSEQQSEQYFCLGEPSNQFILQKRQKNHTEVTKSSHQQKRFARKQTLNHCVNKNFDKETKRDGMGKQIYSTAIMSQYVLKIQELNFLRKKLSQKQEEKSPENQTKYNRIRKNLSPK